MEIVTVAESHWGVEGEQIHLTKSHAPTRTQNDSNALSFKSDSLQ